MACPPCLRRLARPGPPKASSTRFFRQILAGLTAFVCLVALFFAVLSWRTNTPEQHLNFLVVGKNSLHDRRQLACGRVKVFASHPHAVAPDLQLFAMKAEDHVDG